MMQALEESKGSEQSEHISGGTGIGWKERQLAYRVVQELEGGKALNRVSTFRVVQALK